MITQSQSLANTEPSSTVKQFAIRPARVTDVVPLLQLMRELACFEGYLDRFRVDEAALIARGLGAAAGDDAAQFHAFVADCGNGRLAGYAVVYRIPFAYDLRPTLVLKELYVAADARGTGIGHDLMAAVLAHARARDCARLKWDVLPGNEAAKAFYRSLGGQPDSAWEAWLLMLDTPFAYAC